MKKILFKNNNIEFRLYLILLSNKFIFQIRHNVWKNMEFDVES